MRFTSLAVTKSQIPYSFCVKLHLLRKGNQQARFIPKVTMVRFPLLRLLTGSLLGIPAAFFLLPRLIGLLIAFTALGCYLLIRGVLGLRNRNG